MKLRPFELALVLLFGGLGIVALIIVATYAPEDESLEVPGAIRGPVEIWGMLPAEPIQQHLSRLRDENETYNQVSYRFVDPAQFEQSLISALADQRGPDLMLISHEYLVSLRNRIAPISYESFPVRDIQNVYLDGARIFALQDGLYGYPMFIDPLVMYFNRDVLTSAGFIEPPKTWESIVNSVLPTLVRRDSDRTISRSVLAFGEYSNVRNAFATISMLLLQSGSAGVRETGGARYEVRINELVTGESGNPFFTTVDFFTRFSDPSSALYTWNRSLTDDRSLFLRQDLLLYFGFGSEARRLEALNPNFNFDIAEVPQSAAATVRRTYGQMYALMPLRTTDNPADAWTVLNRLTSSDSVAVLAKDYEMVPASRSLVAAGSDDVYGRVRYAAAPVTYGWLNPDRERTDQVFVTMFEDIISNRRSVSDATNDTIGRMQQSY